MSNERHHILNMLKEGKISVSEAEELLKAVENETAEEGPELNHSLKKNLKYLRIVVEPEAGKSNARERVNIRVPLALLRAGAKFTSLLPEKARDKIESALKDKGIGTSMGALNAENFESLIEALGDMSIDVDKDDEKIRIFCE